jgi:hypothetical protein
MKTVFSLLILLVANMSFAQSSSSKSEIVGAGIQIFSSGFIPGFTWEHELNNKSTLRAFGGAIVANDRKSLSKHDKEWGAGLLFGIGYRRYFSSPGEGLYLGADLYASLMRVKWRMNQPFFENYSDVTLLQPMAELGYRMDMGKAWSLDLSVAAGGQFNAGTKGADVGQGFIYSGGLRLNYHILR